MSRCHKTILKILLHINQYYFHTIAPYTQCRTIIIIFSVSCESSHAIHNLLWNPLQFPLSPTRKAHGQYGSGGKSCRLAVRGLPVRSPPGRVEVSLSKTPNPQLLLTGWSVPFNGGQSPVNVCVNGWVRGINCTGLWIKALYKCSPFTIYHMCPSWQPSHSGRVYFHPPPQPNSCSGQFLKVTNFLRPYTFRAHTGLAPYILNCLYSSLSRAIWPQDYRRVPTWVTPLISYHLLKNIRVWTPSQLLQSIQCTYVFIFYKQCMFFFYCIFMLFS